MEVLEFLWETLKVIICWFAYMVMIVGTFKLFNILLSERGGKGE